MTTPKLPKLTTTQYLTGEVQGKKNNKWTTIGYVRMNPCKKESSPKQPDYTGALILYHIGDFKISLWIHEKTTIQKSEKP